MNMCKIYLHVKLHLNFDFFFINDLLEFKTAQDYTYLVRFITTDDLQHTIFLMIWYVVTKIYL